jgi:CubicO group peptidase (beta-lactamase class C family)
VDVLGLLIRRVTDGSLYAFQQEHILGPLGMKDTDFFVPPAKLERAAGFPPEGKKPLQTAPPKAESGGDGMYSTMWDYLRFARMLYNKGELDGKRILTGAIIASMTTDKMRPDEHRSGPYFDRYPGRGFGYTLAVRSDPMPGGPSVGAFNWNGTTGVWFLIDPPKETIVLLMVQHPTSGKNAKTGIPYISKIEENNRYQAVVYADLAQLIAGGSKAH